LFRGSRCRNIAENLKGLLKSGFFSIQTPRNHLVEQLEAVLVSPGEGHVADVLKNVKNQLSLGIKVRSGGRFGQVYDGTFLMFFKHLPFFSNLDLFFQLRKYGSCFLNCGSGYRVLFSSRVQKYRYLSYLVSRSIYHLSWTLVNHW